MCLEISSCCYHHENIFYSCMSNEWPCIESRVIKTYTHTLLPVPVLQRQDEIERGLLPTLYSSMQALHQSMWHLTKGYKNGLKAYEIAGIASQRNVMAAVTCFRSLVLCSERGWGGNACRRWWGKKEKKDIKKLHKFYQYANQKNTL